MVLLDVDFSEGDFLTAGVISSTSSVNGITTTVNSNTLTKLIYVGSDTEGSIADSTAETTIATIVIPANTVTTGIIISAAISGQSANAEDSSIFKIKSGATASEVLRQTITINPVETDSFSGSMLFYDDASTFSAEVTVLITGQNAAESATGISRCDQLVVTGY